MLRRQRERLVQRVRVQGLRSTEHGRQCLNRDPDNVVIRLLRRERAPCRLGVEAKHCGARIPALESLGHDLVPDLAGCTVLRDFFKQIVVCIEKERQPRRKFVDIQTGTARPLDVFDAVIQGEGEFLKRCRAGFANVISADRDRIPLRNVFRSKLECIDDELHRWLGREDVRLLRDVFLQNVVLNRTAQLVPLHALLFCNDQIHRPQDWRRSIGRHRRADLFEGEALEERLHVGQ